MPQPVQFFLHKIEVETHVMGHKNGISCDIDYLSGHLSEDRGVTDHFIRNTGQVANKRGNGAFRIQQRMEGIDNLMAIMAKNGYFGKTGRTFYVSRGFNVNDAIHKLLVYSLWFNVSGCTKQSYCSRVNVLGPLRVTRNVKP